MIPSPGLGYAGTVDYDRLLDLVRDKRLVLIGEASHGTHEFYAQRAEITKRLLDELGFDAVAIEGDWPDAYRVNRYVREQSDDEDAERALRGFRRFPAWMWRNTVVLDFVEWLRGRGAGFYGLDLYSLHASMAAVIEYLDEHGPDEARRARERYACFDHFGTDPQVYGYETGLGGAWPCEDEAVAVLLELQRHPHELLANDEHFFAEQNARLVVNAERYYRSMYRGRQSSWNLRDTHMFETLQALLAHLGPSSRIVVWAHNSHVGDARETQMGWSGELNLGQLARERFPRETLIVGFSTYTGTVTAADDWGDIARRKNVRPGLPGSWEEHFHERGEDRLYLERPEGTRLERAIGVIYRPQTERLSHYFEARVARQFDALIHIDETTALEPLEPTSVWEEGELPETYPVGL
jgi:erythromycin esterase-like protein